MQRISMMCVALVVLATACSSDPPDYAIPDTTKVVDDATAAQIVSITPDGIITFKRGAAFLESLEAEDVLVVGVSDATPSGFLGRVETVTFETEQVVVQTSTARLQDAVERGHVQARRALQMSDAVEITMLREGITVEAAEPKADSHDELEPGEGLVIAFEDLVLYEEGGAEVVLNGNLAVSPSFDITIDVDGFSLEEATFSFQTDEGVSFQLTSGANAVLAEEVPLLDIVFAVITIAIGPVPVVITPTLTVSLGASGRVSAGLSASVTQTAALSLGFGYLDGEWQGFEESTSSFDFDIPSPDAEVSGRIFAGPEFAILIYGATGPFAEANGYMELGASVGGSPPCLSWELAAGIEANVGMRFIADYETTVLNERSVLSSYDCHSDDPPPMPAESFSKTYGGDSADRPVSVQQTPDGGYVFAARTQSYHAPHPTTWVVKTDANGVVQWQKAYRGMELPSSLQLVPGGGYVIAGGQAGSGPDTARVSRLDAGGNVLWAKGYKGTDDTGVVAHALRVLSDGSMVVAGTTELADRNAWVARLDATGEVLWSNTYGGSGTDVANAIDLTTDGGFVVAGETQLSFGDAGESTDYWVLKLDGSGAIDWQRRYGGDGTVVGQNDGVDRGFAVVQLADGGYGLSGQSSSFGIFDAWTLGLSASGDVDWTTNFDGGATFDQPHSMVETADGGLVIVGRGGLRTAESAAWVFKLGPDGGVAWSKTYDGHAADTAGSDLGQYTGIGDAVSLTSDDGLIVVGTTRSFGTDELDVDQDAWLLKLTRTGEVELAPGSGAMIGNLTGEFTHPEHIKAIATSATPVLFPVTVTDTTSEIMTIDTDVVVRTQSP